LNIKGSTISHMAAVHPGALATGSPQKERKNLGARWLWVVSATPRPCYPRERDPVHIVQEAGWAPGPVWKGAENLVPTGIRSPDRPVAILTRPSRPTALRKTAALIPSVFVCSSGDS
jgi:hypothetical protein